MVGRILVERLTLVGIASLVVFFVELVWRPTALSG